jgi:hypothetical protein
MHGALPSLTHLTSRRAHVVRVSVILLVTNSVCFGLSSHSDLRPSGAPGTIESKGVTKIYDQSRRIVKYNVVYKTKSSLNINMTLF